MGNIHREVLPVRRRSLRFRECSAVNRISIHQPHNPHSRKFLPKVLKEFAMEFIIFIDIVYEFFSV